MKEINCPNSREVFSIGIVCYRNWNYLTESIDSVLMQDYPYIQLIISDDGSSGFPSEQFDEYIRQNKRDNIIHYVVRQSEKNEGTVRHLNHVLDCAIGEYLMFMAADDALDNPSVLSRYVTAFQTKGNENCGAMMSQTALYDQGMKRLMGYFVWPDVAEAINTSVNSDKLLNHLYMYPVIPTTTICVRRWVFNQYGKFNTEYKLIEDYPFHLMLAKNKVPLRFLNFVGAKHRDGGISHGALTALSTSKRLYFEDCLYARHQVLKEIEEKPIDPQIKSYNQWQIRANQEVLVTTGAGIKGKIAYARMYPLEAVLQCCQRISLPRISQGLQLLACMLFLYFFSDQLFAALSSILPLFADATWLIVSKGLLMAAMIILSILIILIAIMYRMKKLNQFPYEIL